MPRSGPRTVYRYSLEFKLTAVRLSHQPGMQVQTVAAALEILPFMLSKWRKDVRDGTLRGRAKRPPPLGPAREIGKRQALEKAHAQLLEEHDLRVPPASRLEQLRGDRAGQHSVRINDQWRICFRWGDGDAFDVELVDHH